MAKVDSNAGTPDRRIAGDSGALSSAAAGPWIVMPPGDFNMQLSGTFVATVVVECSLDGGTTAVPVCDESGAPVLYSTPGNRVGQSVESDTLVRVRVATWTSGTVNWRVSR